MLATFFSEKLFEFIEMAEQVSEVTPEKKRSTKERSLDDYKRKIWKLKKELEEQRGLALAVQKEELEKLSQVG